MQQTGISDTARGEAVEFFARASKVRGDPVAQYDPPHDTTVTYCSAELERGECFIAFHQRSTLPEDTIADSVRGRYGEALRHWVVTRLPT